MMVVDGTWMEGKKLFFLPFFSCCCLLLLHAFVGE